MALSLASNMSASGRLAAISLAKRGAQGPEQYRGSRLYRPPPHNKSLNVGASQEALLHSAATTGGGASWTEPSNIHYGSLQGSPTMAQRLPFRGLPFRAVYAGYET